MDAGVDADQLMREAGTEPLKKQLFVNTTRSAAAVPTSQVVYMSTHHLGTIEFSTRDKYTSPWNKASSRLITRDKY